MIRAPKRLRLRSHGRCLRAVLCAAGMLSSGCPSAAERPDGLDPSTMPDSVRADYGLFAERCSKCHSLARPLESGVDKDEYWQYYVARMRRQPASGISERDVIPILRFLHYYSLELQRIKGKSTSADPSAHEASPYPDAQASTYPDAP
jgi:hypothetical protein